MSRVRKTDVVGALAYLTVRSIRNSVVSRLNRLRQPRYLFIGLALVFWIGTMIFNRSRSPIRIPDEYEQLARIIAAIMFFGVMVLSWILSSSAALRFTLAEVNILFPAPIERQRLLQYKIARLLLGAAGSSLFFTLVFGPVRPVAAALFAFKTMVVVGVLGLVEAGVALYRINAKASSGASAKVRLPILAASVTLMAISAWVLAVFAFIDDVRSFLRVVPVIALLLFACIVWILASDVAFEEEAAINADKVRAAVQRLQRGQPRISARRSTPFALAPTGPAELAILWKNWLLFGRASRRWLIVIAFVLVCFVGGFYGAARASGDLSVKWEAAPLLLLIIAGAVVLMGPIMVRSDLRRDLAHLVVMKTWPVSGAAIVRGEVLAPAIALTLAAVAAIVPAALLAPAALLPAQPSPSARFAFATAASLAATTMILAQLVIQNGIAAMFPAWIRLRTGGAGAGVEGMGQMLVVMYGGLFVLGLAALVPAGAAAVVMFLFGGMLLPAVVFASLLLVECFAATEIIGRILERTDLQDVG